MDSVHNRLRAWRMHTARELNLPAYFILTNASLAAVALARPTSLNELAKCPGLGPKKLSQFGIHVLEVVDLALAEGLEPGVTPPDPGDPVVEPNPADLTADDMAAIAKMFRRETARRIARQSRGRYTAAQVEEALRRLWATA